MCFTFCIIYITLLFYYTISTYFWSGFLLRRRHVFNIFLINKLIMFGLRLYLLRSTSQYLETLIHIFLQREFLFTCIRDIRWNLTLHVSNDLL